jgi:chemotaxis signal transduction protein
MLKTFAPQLLSFSNHTKKNTFKSIAFQVSSYWFALPIGSVLKIIPCPLLDSPIKNCLGLVEWEKQVVTVIDLSQKISVELGFAKSNPSKKISHEFLILTQTRTTELCGFLTQNDSILIDIPIANIHSIPSSYRQVADLSIISKMAILNQPETEQTLKIFLLGEWN